MSRAGVELDGGAELVSGLDHAAEALADLGEPARRAVAFIASAATPATPRKSGQLAGGMRSTVSVGVGWVYNAEPYAGVVHWGWRARGISGRSWLSDTATRTESQWLTEYDDYVQHTIDSV